MERVNIFKEVQIFESAPASLLFPENCSAESLDGFVNQIWEPVHTDRNFVPWFHYQAAEYLELSIRIRIKDILKKHCE